MITQKINVGAIPPGDEFKPRFDGEPLLLVLDVDPNEPIKEREWAVYLGPESKGEDYILKHGIKVNREFAEFLFPRLQGRYRV